jgi:hypothetical protein
LDFCAKLFLILFEFLLREGVSGRPVRYYERSGVLLHRKCTKAETPRIARIDSHVASDRPALQSGAQFGVLSVLSVQPWSIPFWREGSDDLLEARIAAQRVPKGQQFQVAIARKRWIPRGNGELFAS